MSDDSWSLANLKNKILLSDQEKISYSHLFNCVGLQAGRVVHKFGVGQEYTMLPFRGGYYQLKPNAPLAFRTNLYPVPDLEVPFLGVHISPSVMGLFISAQPQHRLWEEKIIKGLKKLNLYGP